MLGVQLSVIAPRDLEPLRVLYRTALNENTATKNQEVTTKDGQLVLFCLPPRIIESLAEQIPPLPHVLKTKSQLNKANSVVNVHAGSSNSVGTTAATNAKSTGFTPTARGSNYSTTAGSTPSANTTSSGRGPVSLLSPASGMAFQHTPSPTQVNSSSTLNWTGTLRWTQIENPHVCALNAKFISGANKNVQPFPLDRLPTSLEISTVYARDQLGIEPKIELKTNGGIHFNGLSTLAPEEKKANDLRLETMKQRLNLNECYGYVQLPANPENKDLLLLAFPMGGRMILFALVVPSMNSGQTILRNGNVATPQQIGAQGTLMSPTALGQARGQQTPTPAQIQGHTQAQVQAQAQMLHNRQMGSPMVSNQTTQQQIQQQKQQQMMFGRHMQ